MKKYLVENAGYVHMVLFIIWLLGAMALFAVGTPLAQEAIWVPIVSLIALVLQLFFAVMESEWTEQVLNESGYGES